MHALMTYVDDEDDDMVVIDFRFRAVYADYFRFIMYAVYFRFTDELNNLDLYAYGAFRFDHQGV